MLISIDKLSKNLLTKLQRPIPIVYYTTYYTLYYTILYSADYYMDQE